MIDTARIQSAISEYGATPTQLAEIVGIATRTMQRIKAGQKPSYYPADRIATALSMHISEFEVTA